MNNTHTPGPWEVWTDPGIETRDLSVGPVNGGVAVADIVTTNAHGIATAESIGTGHANARLIAAAPELLEALEAIANCLSSISYTGEVWDNELAAARAIIAKAKGGQ
jgi:hypothetical protein